MVSDAPQSCKLVDSSLFSGPRRVISKCNCKFKRNTPHWQEKKNNIVICAGLSLTDPKSQLFVDACMQHPDFLVMTRKGADGPVVRSSQRLWASRTRQADTRANLEKVPWDKAEQWTSYRESLLEEAQPPTTTTEVIRDCYQVAIIDDGDGELQDFVDKLVDIWIEVYDAEDVVDLFDMVAGPILDSGELEIADQKTTGYPLVRNTELDVMVSYELLWGKAPSEGHLVDDEMPSKIRI